MKILIVIFVQRMLHTLHNENFHCKPHTMKHDLTIMALSLHNKLMLTKTMFILHVHFDKLNI